MRLVFVPLTLGIGIFSSTSLSARMPINGGGTMKPIDSDPCANAIDEDSLARCLLMRGGGGDGNSVDPEILLAQCLAKAIADYTTCVANAPSVIPYKTAYNMGKCEVDKTNAILSCHAQYDQ